MNAPQEVRLIGGTLKRSLLPVVNPSRGVDGLRPTLARVRQTLFDWLGHDLTGWRVLDAYAGTGALGLEAASRGAASVGLVDQHPAVAAHLQSLRARFAATLSAAWPGQVVSVRRGDGLSTLQAQAAGSLDLVLLDPPFELSSKPAKLAPLLVAAHRALAPGGLVYLEMDAAAEWQDALQAAPGLAPHREGRAGAVAFRLLVKT
jgi:16S rRNA (guanine(966)-N(2))-methyltransferase RsmD